MTEKRFGIIKTKTYGLYVPVDKMEVYNFSSFESELDCIRVVNALNNFEEKSRENGKLASKYLEENEQLKQQLSDINGQLVMLDNCDNWDYDRMKHTVREIAEIIGYNGTINPKR